MELRAAPARTFPRVLWNELRPVIDAAGGVAQADWGTATRPGCIHGMVLAHAGTFPAMLFDAESLRADTADPIGAALLRAHVTPSLNDMAIATFTRRTTRRWGWRGWRISADDYLVALSMTLVDQDVMAWREDVYSTRDALARADAEWMREIGALQAMELFDIYAPAAPMTATALADFAAVAASAKLFAAALHDAVKPEAKSFGIVSYFLKTKKLDLVHQITPFDPPVVTDAFINQLADSALVSSG